MDGRPIPRIIQVTIVNKSVKNRLAAALPFMFIYNPQLLLENVTLLSGIQVVVTACIGVLLIAAAVEGYLRGRLNWMMRVVAAMGALLLIDGGGMTDLLGFLCLAVIVGVQMAKVRLVPADSPAV